MVMTVHKVMHHFVHVCSEYISDLDLCALPSIMYQSLPAVHDDDDDNDDDDDALPPLPGSIGAISIISLQ